MGEAQTVSSQPIISMVGDPLRRPDQRTAAGMHRKLHQRSRIRDDQAPARGRCTGVGGRRTSATSNPGLPSDRPASSQVTRTGAGRGDRGEPARRRLAGPGTRQGPTSQGPARAQRPTSRRPRLTSGPVGLKLGHDILLRCRCAGTGRGRHRNCRAELPGGTAGTGRQSAVI